MKKKLTLLIAAMSFAIVNAQNTAIRLCDFDTVKRVSFADYNGQLDSMMVNPDMSGANTSAQCARYVRSTAAYDNIKFYIKTEFTDVSTFAQANTPNKISLMVMSTMPVGSRVEIQLGSREFITYPEGIHSVYSATTTMQKKWETLTFNLTSNLSGNGGFMNAGNCNKMVVLFNPNATTQDTIYFDEVMGPPLKEAVGIYKETPQQFSNISNTPNPAANSTTIRFSTVNAGQMSLSVTDLYGRQLHTMALTSSANSEEGVELDTTHFPNGVYFYTLKSAQTTVTKRLVVARH
jgi:hypothetical protein